MTWRPRLSYVVSASGIARGGVGGPEGLAGYSEDVQEARNPSCFGWRGGGRPSARREVEGVTREACDVADSGETLCGSSDRNNGRVGVFTGGEGRGMVGNA